MDEAEIDAGDAVRLVLQFLKENRLFSAMKALQDETQIHLNAVDSIDTLVNDILQGRWDAVMQHTQTLESDTSVMMELYEHVVVELLELKEKDVAVRLLRMSEPLRQMKATNIERYTRLEGLAKHVVFDAAKGYGGSSKHERRVALAAAVKNSVQEAPPSRLLTLLGQALKWQHAQGMIAAGADQNLFTGTSKAVVHDKLDRTVRKAAGKIKFGKSSKPQCVLFSRDGRSITSGSKDGFIEVWDHEKCKLRKDLEYQANEEFMMHDAGVTAQAHSGDGELLATGSEDGKVKIWKITSGVCLRRFDSAHAQSITSICFSKDGTQVLTASFDHLVRLHGLKSGQTLKEFQGHQSYVNRAVFSADGSQVVSASSDGTVKIWNVKTSECVRTLQPPSASLNEEIDVVNVHLVPKVQGSGSNILLCSRTAEMHLVSMDGELLKTFKTDANNASEVGNFVDSTISPRGKLLYGVTDTGYLLVFALETAGLEATVQVSNNGVLGIAHHPNRNLVATFGSDGYVRLWKA